MKSFLMQLSTLSLLCTTAAFAEKGYEEIPDLSELPLLNPDLKERTMGKIRLNNGIEALLISDPKADHSSASVAVDTGSWNDPEEYPGMAHFCEHMLFMGSAKYPDSNDFMERVNEMGGHTNAFTAPDRTVYMFSAKEEGFLDCLDRFSRFFIDPLFNPADISRELHAVEQEFAKNLEHDGWRTYMIFKELGNPEHPNRKFSTGNAQTLAQIPSSALQSWHKEEYGADRMHLFLYSSLPLETMKEKVVQLFSDVPKATRSLLLSTLPLTSERQKGKITYIQPIQHRQTVNLYWELPRDLAKEESHAAELLAYTLNRGQANSLYETLQSSGWIDSVRADVDEMGSPENRLFSIELSLTAKGMASVDQVILRCFEALALVRKAGVPPSLFHEMNQISRLHYQYQTREDPFQIAQDIGSTLPNEPLALYPQQRVLATQYSSSKMSRLLQGLTPKECSIVIIAPPAISGVSPDQKEKWFQAEYAVRPIPSTWIASWEKAKPNPQIKLPPPNPFVPKELTQISANAETIPILFSNNEHGMAYYTRAPEFSAPEASIQLQIRSPKLLPTAKSAVLASLYLDHLTDLLHPTLSAAKSAGLAAQFDLYQLSLRVQINGFSDKAPLLLKTLVEKMPQTPPTREQFATYVERHEKEYANRSKELPCRQAQSLLYSLLLEGNSLPEEKLAALRTIQYEEFLAYHAELFEKTYATALFGGNLSLEQVQSAWAEVEHVLNRGLYPLEDHIQSKVLELPPQAGPFSISRTTLAQGNSSILAIDQGAFTLEKKAVQEILATMLKHDFFNELRTKQKTGYIAVASPLELEERLFTLLMVQSNSHQPEDLLYRFELFLEEFVHTLPEQLSLERFETLKQSCLHSLKTRFRNLKDKTALWALLAFEKGADFQYVEKRLSALEALTLPRFLSLASEVLSRQNHRRLAILFEGRLPAPFIYESIDPAWLVEVRAREGDKKSERSSP